MTDNSSRSPIYSATKRITKADLLLAGWHSIYEGDEERWAHPDIPRHPDCTVAVAKAMQAFWNKQKELASVK